MGSATGDVIFPALLFAVVIGIGLYRARDEPAWKVVLAIWAGLGVAAIMALVLLWAGTDTTRLTVVLVPVAVTAALMMVALVVRGVRRRRSAPPSRSPFDFT